MKFFIFTSLLTILLPLKVVAETPVVHANSTNVSVSKPEKNFTISISPLHLILPVVELMVEKQLIPKVSVAAIIGGGKVGDYTIWEAGVQARYYFWGSFAKGLNAGAEVVYLGASGSTGEYDGAGNGLTAGAFLGGKYSFGFGLALELQVGYQLLLVSATASNGTNSTSDESSDSGVLLNLNMGFTF